MNKLKNNMSDNKTYTCQYCDNDEQYNRKEYFKHIKTERHKEMYNIITSNSLYSFGGRDNLLSVIRQMSR